MMRNLIGWILMALCIALSLYLAQKGGYDLWNAMFRNRGSDHVLPAVGELFASFVALKITDRIILCNSYGR